MKSMKLHLAQIFVVSLLSIIAYSSWSHAGIFGGDIKIKFNRKVPSEVNLSDIKRIAVVHIENDHSNRIANTVGAYLQDTGEFEIFERAQLQRIMAEHNLTVTGTINESSAAEIGEMLGVEALIYGSVNSFKVYDENTEKKIRIKTGEEEYTTKKGKVKKRNLYGDIMAPTVIRHGELDLTLKVVAVETAVIRTQRNKRTASENVKINHVQADQKELPSEGDVEALLIQQALTDFIQYVTPYMVADKLKWDDDCKDKDVEELVKAEMFEEAREYLETSTLEEALANKKERKKKKKKDRELAAIYYNTGLLYEIESDLEKADELYKQALMTSIKKAKKEIKEARKRVKKQMTLWQTYHDQLASNP